MDSLTHLSPAAQRGDLGDCPQLAADSSYLCFAYWAIFLVKFLYSISLMDSSQSSSELELESMSSDVKRGNKLENEAASSSLLYVTFRLESLT